MADLPEQLTTEGFNKLFEQFYKEGLSYIDAYVAAEKYHIDKYGKIRFKSYESFRSSRKNLIFGQNKQFM